MSRVRAIIVAVEKW